MNNALVSMTRPGAEAAVGLHYATVTGRSDKWYFLGAAGIERAQRADSCLIQPDCGDTVLVCAGGGNAPAYILAVLARAERDSAVLALPGGVALNTDHGKLTVSGRQLEMAATEGLTLQAPTLGVAALRGEMKFGSLETSAQQVQARFGAVSLMARVLNSTVDRLVQKAKNSLRWTEGLDETRAGRVRAQVQGRHEIRAGHATVIAEGQVKIDGEKIDLG
ncbi:DUF3540 domain-containing protein [Herbaspirillum robiniae]|uniref:DUF3540 domain-containing protein n=1 Tax=Herbaspirillum robiniae TaxID=2014887 RepID=A0ABX2LYY1_9BURK|nr:DUF3540 domain-containing protein [Herbaspirillum robiniae]NUU02188.1 DUF3540 domain-containing protein [Herbaspirillum robiniae]